jgi:serine/threonine protein kinase
MNNPVTGFTFQGAHTAPWAPPEQIEGAPAHPSADVYAWGRVIGFMLTARTGKEAISSLPPPWQAILAPCVEIAADRRPDVNTITRELTKLSC